MSEYVSVTEYAKLHGLDTGRVRRLIKEGRLPAVRIGERWAIKKDQPKPEDKRIKTGEYVNWRERHSKR